MYAEKHFFPLFTLHLHHDESNPHCYIAKSNNISPAIKVVLWDCTKHTSLMNLVC